MTSIVPKISLRVAIPLILVAVAASSFVLSAPVADAAGCTACQGPTRSVTALGSGETCAAAIQSAETQATIAAFSGGISCIPCQGQMSAHCTDDIVCRPAPGQTCPSFFAEATYTYKCKTCGPL